MTYAYYVDVFFAYIWVVLYRKVTIRQRFLHARRQRSVIGGHKQFFWGGIFFSSNSRMNTKKNVFIPNYAACVRVCCLLPGHNFCTGMGARSSPGRGVGTTGLYGANLGTCPQIYWWRPKKRSSSRNLSLPHDVYSYFCPTTKVYSRLLGTSSTLGGTGPKLHFSATGPVALFWGTILAWGHKQWFEGHGPKMPLVAPGLVS